MKPNLQHAIERVERPSGSHEGVGRKKSAEREFKSVDAVKLLNDLAEAMKALGGKKSAEREFKTVDAVKHRKTPHLH